MYLSKYEEKLLLGEKGPALAKAMEVLVKVGEAMGAESFVPISHAHVSGVSIFNVGEYGLEFLKELAELGARVSVYTTVNPASLVINNRYVHKLSALQREIIRVLTSLGVDPKSFTCLPYRLRRPRIGEHLGWAESSAVIMANSVFGARTNREGGPIALLEAIVGRAPAYGMHLSENRVPTEIVELRMSSGSILKWSLAGLRIGELTKGIPLIVFKGSKPSSMLEIKNLLASIASTSDSPMAFLEGITPEKPVNTESLERIVIDEAEVKYCAESVDTVILGCPHLEEDEARYLLKRIAVEIGVCIQRIIVAVPTNFRLPSVKDVVDELERMGISVEFVFGSCPVVTRLNELGMRVVATPHGKALHYLPKLAMVSTCPLNI